MAKKTFALFGASAAILLSGAALADDRIPEDGLNPAYVIYKLAGEGRDVRGIEYENGVYVVDIATGDGQIYRAAVDRFEGNLNPHAFMKQKIRRDPAPAGALPASDIIQLAADAGHWQVTELEFDDGHYEVTALDHEFGEVKLAVDPISGEVRHR